MTNGNIERYGWILTAEEKPKKCSHYLVTRCNPTRTTMLFFEGGKWWSDSLHTSEWPGSLIVAWKPLPKPYRENK